MYGFSTIYIYHFMKKTFSDSMMWLLKTKFLYRLSRLNRNMRKHLPILAKIVSKTQRKQSSFCAHSALFNSFGPRFYNQLLTALCLCSRTMKVVNPLTYKRPKAHDAAKILYTNQTRSKRIFHCVGAIGGFVGLTCILYNATLKFICVMAS